MRRLLLLPLLLILTLSAYAQQRLRYQTATTIRIGQFKKLSDNTLDGAQTVTNFRLTVIPHSNTTGVTVTAFTPTASGGTHDCVHVTSANETGLYECELTAIDTATLGRMDIVATTIGTACQPVLNQFTVVGMDEFDRAEGGDGVTIEDVFAQPTSSMTVSASFGALVVQILDAAISSRMASAPIITVPQNTIYSNFTFRMRDAATGLVPTAGLSVTCKVSKDGGAFATCTNAVTAIGGGAYKTDMAAADLDADETYFVFSAAGGRDVEFKIRPQR